MAESTRFLVADSQKPGAGQVSRSQFLDELHTHLTAVANAVLAPLGETAADCAYLRFWFTYYQDKDAQHIEESIRRFAPETTQAKNWEDQIRQIGERIRKSFSQFVATGKIADVPSDVPKDLSEKEAKAKNSNVHQPRATAPSVQRVTMGSIQPIQLCACCCCAACRPRARITVNPHVARAVHHAELTSVGTRDVRTATEMDGTHVSAFEDRKLEAYREPQAGRRYFTATKGSSVDGIRSHGLDPAYGGGGGGSVSTARNVGAYNSHGHAYFFSTESAATQYAKNNVDDQVTGTYAVVEFTLPATLVFTPDPEADQGGKGTAAFRTDQAIPASCIVRAEVVDRKNRNARKQGSGGASAAAAASASGSASASDTVVNIHDSQPPPS